MITATSIHSGESYLSKHFRANDYYAEGETTVCTQDLAGIEELNREA